MKSPRVPLLLLLLLTAGAGALPATEALLIGPADKCLGVDENPVSRSRVVIQRCLPGERSLWTVPARGFEGEFRLAGLCLDVDQASTADFTPIQLFTCQGGANQRWRHESDGRLVGLGGKCLDIADNQTADGSPAILFGCHGNDNQTFLAENQHAWGPTDVREGFDVARLHATADSRLLYFEPSAGASAGLMRSADQGANWTPVGPPQPFPRSPLLIDREDADVLWKTRWRQDLSDADDLQRSDDGGRTWRTVFRFDEPIYLLAQSRVDPRDLVAVGSESFWASDDRGNSFRRRGELELPWQLYGLGQPEELLETADGAWIVPLLSQCMPFGMGCEWHVLRTADFGASWQQAYVFRTTAMNFSGHPRERDTFYGIAARGQVTRSDDGGLAFNHVGQIPDPVTGPIVVRPDTLEIHGDRLVAARVWAVYGGALWRSDNRGLSWVEVARDLILGAEWGAFSLAFPEPQTLVLATGKTREVATRMLISRNGGATWSVLADNVHGGRIDLVAASARPGRFYAGGTYQTGLMRTDDHGRTWQTLHHEACLQSILADPIEPDTVYVASDSSCSLPLLARSRDGLETLENIAPLASPIEIDDLIAYRHGEGKVMMATLVGNTGTLFRSTNEGTTWQSRVLAGPISGLWTDGQIAYARVRVGQGAIVQMTSHDGGTTWGTTTHPPLALFTAGGGKYAGYTFNSLHVVEGTEVHASPIPAGGQQPLHLDRYGRLYYQIGESTYRSLDNGRTWQSLEAGLTAPITQLAADPSDSDRLMAATPGGPVVGRFPDDTVLTLGRGRFQVTVFWRQSQIHTGKASSRQLTTDSGAFWFFTAERSEVIVKVLDGRAINGRFWVFVGSLTSVAFDLEVRDLASGERKVYHHIPDGSDQFVSFGDNQALPLGAPELSLGPPDAPNFYGTDLDSEVQVADRFDLEVEWRTHGQNGVAQGTLISGESAAFTFFSPENVELLVNVIDGRPLNGHFWVFAASLSNVEYTLRVRDTLTGAVRVYENPSGTFASFGDTSAFPE